jgi:hypothetical protein
MATRNGTSSLWKSTDSAGAGGASSPGNVAFGSAVAVFIQNTGGGAKTFKVQAATSGSRSAGRNELSGTPPDYGLVWCDVQKADGSGDVILTTGSGDNTCFDLSPFAPELIRLVSVEGFAQGQIVATAVASGG